MELECGRAAAIGLFPLVPLTQGGKEHKVVQKVIGGLLDAGKTDLSIRRVKPLLSSTENYPHLTKW